MNALLALPDLQPERLFVQTGDVRLAVHCWGAPDNGKPTLLMVHGYPDNHETWLPLIRQLAGRYRIVAYDVRRRRFGQATLEPRLPPAAAQRRPAGGDPRHQPGPPGTPAGP